VEFIVCVRLFAVGV